MPRVLTNNNSDTSPKVYTETDTWPTILSDTNTNATDMKYADTNKEIFTDTANYSY